MESIYLKEDVVLTSSHGSVFYEKNDRIFAEMLDKITHTGSKIRMAFDDHRSMSLENIASKGILFGKPSTELLKTFKELVYFMESWTAYHHIMELVENGHLIEKGKNHWILSPETSTKYN